MKPASFAYRRPTSLEQALVDVAADPGGKVLAGGQSLVPLLSMRLASPTTLVDLGGIPDLDTIEVTDAGVRVGALARQAAVLAHEGVRRCQPLVNQALGHVAHATIRNRGTTLGSIVHADSAAEMPMVLRLLGGSVEVAWTEGRRTIAAEELFVGPLETSLRPDEIATSAFFPALAPGAGTGFAEVARRHGDYALVGVGAVVSPDTQEARVGYLSVCDTPTVVDVSGLAPEEAGQTALAHLDPTDDIHASADYRAHLVQVLTEQALRAAAQQAARMASEGNRP